MDDLAKSTGINRGRIEKALQELEKEELVHHITLEGTPRFYVAAIALGGRSSGKINLECSWCGETGFKSNGSLGQHKRRCRKRVVPENPINPPKEIKPPLVLDSPSITTTGDAMSSWSIGQEARNVIQLGGKEVENKEVEPMEELGKVGQYNQVRCPQCGTVWRLIKVLTYKPPTAILVECPFCRT